MTTALRRAAVVALVAVTVVGMLALDRAPAEAIRPFTVPGVTTVTVDSQFAYDIALSTDGRTAYTPMLDGSVRVMDLVSRSQKATVRFGSGLNNATVSADGSRVYFSDYWGSAVQSIRTDTNAALPPIQLPGQPHLLDLIGDGARLAAYTLGRVSIIDLADTTVTTFALPDWISGPSDVAYSADGEVIYALTGARTGVPSIGGTLTAFRLENATELWSVPLPDDRFSLQTSPDGATAYVSGSTGVTVVDLADGSTSTVAGVTGVVSALLDPEGARLAVMTDAHEAVVVNTATQTVVSRAQLWNPGAVSFFSPTGDSLVVNQQDPTTQEGFVVELSATTGAIRSTVPVSIGRWLAVVSPDGRTALFSGSYQADFIQYPRTPYAPGVARFNGWNRYATSSDVAAEYNSTASTVYITSGESFPDALGAAAVAGSEHAPLLLNPSSYLDGSTGWRLGDFYRPKVVIVGGAGAISPAVESQIALLASSVQRIAGADRYDTARKLLASKHAPGSAPANVLVATGVDFPDALSAATAAGASGLPLIIVDGRADHLDPSTRALLVGLGAQAYTVVGGQRAVSAGIENELAALAPVTRASGADRYATSVALNSAFFTDPHQAYLASGTGFADALAGSALAAAQDSPLYITTPGCLVPGVAGALDTDALSLVKLLGGTGALGQGVERLQRC